MRKNGGIQPLPVQRGGVMTGGRPIAALRCKSWALAPRRE